MAASLLIDEVPADAFIDDRGVVIFTGYSISRYTLDVGPLSYMGLTKATQVFSKPVAGDFTMASGVDGGIGLVGVKRTRPSIGDTTLRSTIAMFDGDGTARWTGSVPWEVRQPPIEGGHGRVLLAGDGLVALEQGIEVWQMPSLDQPIRAITFADGWIAIAKGSALQILDPNGDVKKTLATPDGESLITPPAIASDGSIWVASRDHLYVAR